MIPTKDNLVCRIVIHLNSLVCLGGCKIEETINHILLTVFFFFTTFWIDVLRWSGSKCFACCCGLHVFQFFGSHLFYKDIRYCFHAIWMTCIRSKVIWKEYNSSSFFFFLPKSHLRSNYQIMLSFIHIDGLKLKMPTYFSTFICCGLTLQFALDLPFCFVFLDHLYSFVSLGYLMLDRGFFYLYLFWLFQKIKSR